MLVVAWTMPTYRGTSLVRLVVSTSQLEHCFSTPTQAWKREIKHPEPRPFARLYLATRRSVLKIESAFNLLPIIITNKTALQYACI